MYRYAVGSGEWEDYHEIELWHTKKFTSEEFTEMCKTAEQRLASDDIFGDIKIANYLVQKYGFIEDVFPRVCCYIYNQYR